MHYKITRTKLNNGIKIVHYYLPYVNSTTSVTRFNVGSRHEHKEEIYGIAHFLEHMMFNGSHKRPGDKSKLELIGIGGQQNAWTWIDETVYYTRVPSDKFRQAFEILFDRVTNPLLRRKDMLREKGIIEEEYHRTQDNPDRILWYQFDELVFHNDKLMRHKVLGTLTSIKSMNQQNLKKFFKTYYSPNNCTLLFLSNLKFEKCLKESEKLFGTLRPVEIPKQIAAVNKQGKRKFKFTQTNKASTTSIALGGFGPSYKEDHLEVELINYILTEGESSVLVDKLHNKLGLVNSIHSENAPFQDTGMIGIEFKGNTKNVQAALLETTKTLKRAMERGFAKKDIKRAKEQLKAYYTKLLEDTISGLWSIINPFREEIIGQSEFDPQESIKRIKIISNDDLIKSAKKWFNPEKMSLSVVSNDKEAKRIIPFRDNP